MSKTGADVMEELEQREAVIADIRKQFPNANFPEPVKEPVFFGRFEERFVINGKQVIIDKNNQDKPFDIVSDRYDLVYHEEVVDTLLRSCPEEFGEPSIDLDFWNEGARFKATATFPEMGNFEVREGDPVKPRVIMFSSYDRSMFYGSEFGAEQLVCSNGLVAYRMMEKNRKRHIISSSAGVNSILETTRMALVNFSDQMNIWQQWAKLKLGFDTAEALVSELPFSSNEQEKIIELPLIGRNRSIKELGKNATLWDVNSAATQYTGHEVSSEQRRVDLEAKIAKVISKHNL